MHSAPEGFRPRTAAARVWLVRHGLSTFNVQGLSPGCCDQPLLTDRSREAARLTAQALAEQEFSAALAGLLPFDGETAGCFQPRPPGITVIHYPGGGEPAVLQAVNLMHDAAQRSGPQFVKKDWCIA